MQKTLLRVLALVLLALLVRYTTVAAQSGQDHASRREMRTYYEANVLPAVRQQRQRLEAQLSTPDKVQLAAYRAQLRDVQQRGRALRQSLRPAGTPAGTRPELTESQRQQLQQLRAEGRTILLGVAQLAQRYDAQISPLLQQLQPQREKWAADIEAIKAKNSPPEPLSAPVRRHPRGSFAGDFSRPTRFLLLDSNSPAPVEAAAASSAFPNPAVATLQLEYGVKKAGPVTVEVLDGRGTVLRTIVQQDQDKGPHTVSADVAALPAGTYFYRITTRAGVETKRFVKQ